MRACCAALFLLLLAASPEHPLADELRRAKEALEAGSLPRAAVALSAVITKLELDRSAEGRRELLADAHFHLGVTLLALTDVDSARESFRDVVGLVPDFQVDEERYAPRLVALFEEVRDEWNALRDGSSAPPPEREDGNLPLWIGLGGASATAGIVAARGEDGGETRSIEPDRDGDGFTASAGDCDDTNPRVYPGGEIRLEIRFAFTGTIRCARTNQQQIYTVSNESCETFSFLGLERQVETVDSQGRATASLTTTLPVLTRTVPAGESVVIREGAAGGTVEALCRDLEAVDPFSRPRGDLRVDETYVLRSERREITATNSFLVLDTAECPFCSLDSLFGPYALRDAPVSAALTWSSSLHVPGGRAELVVNGESRSLVEEGHSRLSVPARPGRNLVEARLLAGSGAPGVWRLEIDEPGNFEIQVLEGEAVLATARSVEIRFLGNAGERAAWLVWRKK